MITTGRHRPGAGGSRGSIKSAGMLLQPSSIHFLSDHNSDIMSHVLSTDIERNITDISRKIVANGDYPKIQAVEKDGNWFTLNNSQLELCRRLEREGCCQRVKVDVVSITEVPIQLRGMMVLPRTDATLPTDVREAGTVEGVRPAQDPATEPPSLSKTVTGPEQQAQPDVEAASDASRSTGKGYQKLETAEPSDKGAETKQTTSAEKTEVTDTSDDSDTDEDSDSECEYIVCCDGDLPLASDWSQDEADSSDGKSTDDDRSTDDERECLL